MQDLDLTWDTRQDLFLKKNYNIFLGPSRLAHLFAKEYVGLEYITKEKFDEYYKFAVVRDPYTRIISELNYQGIKRKKSFFSRGFESIEQYINGVPKSGRSDAYRHICPQADYLLNASRQEILVDEILKFENLADDFLRISEKVFGEKLPLPRRNSTTAKNWRVEDISETDRQFIAEFYKIDFTMFEYAT